MVIIGARFATSAAFCATIGVRRRRSLCAFMGEKDRRMAQRPLLVIMARAPICGAVKKRLATEIGAVRAVALYRSLTGDLLRKVAHDPRFRTVLAIAPGNAVHARFSSWTLEAKPKGRARTGRAWP